MACVGGGEKPCTACHRDSDCLHGRRLACWTFAGDGCAENCTEEQRLRMELQSSGSAELAAASHIAIFEPPGVLVLPLSGSPNVMAGRERNGTKTFAVPVASAEFPPVGISTLACACTRSVEHNTCGMSPSLPMDRLSNSATKDSPCPRRPTPEPPLYRRVHAGQRWARRCWV